MTQYIHYIEISQLTGEKSYSSVPEGTPIPAGAIPVACQPEQDFQAHNETGEMVIDHAGLADATAGAEHIAFAHLVKSVEARMILSGIAVQGLLTAEAEALGIGVEDLAAQVQAKADAFVQAEIARRLAKTQI